MAQIAVTLGDFAGNRKKILKAVQQARAEGCELVIFPELTLFGYLPTDLLERPSLVDAQLKEFEKLTQQIPSGIAALVGVVTRTGKRLGKPFYNSAGLIKKGRKPRFFHKELLPTYDVFDEARHMEKGRLAKNRFSYGGYRFQLTICEDIWGWELPDHQTNYLENPLVDMKATKVDFVLNMSASPYTTEKVRDRLKVIARTAKHLKAPLLYVNLVGAQDELIFDGCSVAVSATGRVWAQGHRFREDLLVVDLENKKGPQRSFATSAFEDLRQALVLGIRDFVRKSGLQRVHLGLSGGVDSALVACLAAEAVGAENLTCFWLPGPFSSKQSKDLAKRQARAMGVPLIEIPIQKTYDAAVNTLQASLGNFAFGVVNENLQARLRGMFLMAYANKENSLLLTTGNKSEYATGYTTLYGDMCGGLAPIGDVLKGEVYELCRLYNRDREIIPSDVLTRAPSAELRPGQKDQDTLPPYPELDRAVHGLVARRHPARTQTEKWLLKTLYRTEFKRWQAPPILKVSIHAFGRGRRMPIAHAARDY